MSGLRFTASQLSALSERFAGTDDGSILGSWMADGTIEWDKLDSVSVLAALGAIYATVAQGANADTAFSWGDHALAGYLTLATTPQGYHDSLTAAGTETGMTLSTTPVGSVFVIYTAAAGTPVVWRLTTDYTISGDTITFVTVTPLGAGDKVDVQYIG